MSQTAFWALDVETANADRSSICQIGAVEFVLGKPQRTISSLIDPEAEFNGMNVSIHGIDAARVAGAPVFGGIYPVLRDAIGSGFVVTHTAFDRTAVHRACARAGVEPPSWQWIDSASCARRAWPDVAWRGYGLAALSERLGISFRHHDAAEDARAAGHILVAASLAAGIEVPEWISRCRAPIDPLCSGKRISLSGNPAGVLAGEVVVFTGALSMLRADAARLAAAIGCDVDAGVTKRTTMLVCGNGAGSKLAKAQRLIKAGQDIELLTEPDFTDLVQIYA